MGLPHRLFLAAVIALAAGVATAQPVRVVSGPLVIAFDQPLDRVGLPRNQFGIFRASEPPRQQHIEEFWRQYPLPQGGSAGFLVLPYNVSGRDTYNGWWLKAGDADWTPYRDGALVLRLRRLDPRRERFPRSVDIGRADTPGTSKLRIELKAGSGTGTVRSAGLPVTLTSRHDREQRAHGYIELRVPLGDFQLDLNCVREVVLMFENRLVPPSEQSGAIALQRIHLTRQPDSRDAHARQVSARVLDKLEKQAFLWFQKHRHPVSGLVLDRAPNRDDFVALPDHAAMASVASVGFFLSLLPAWVEADHLSREAAEAQAVQTLSFVAEHVAHHRGVLYHFVDWQSGRRWGTSEASLLDSAIMLNGAAVAGAAFGGRTAELADQLLDRVEWPEFVVGELRSGKPLLSLGWSPEQGLLGAADVRSSEMAMSYFLAVGARHAIDPQLWYNTTINDDTIYGQQVLNANHPLFTSQYGLCWHDLRDKVDRDGVDLFANARAAALMNREACRRRGASCPAYAVENGGWWGISAGDFPRRDGDDLRVVYAAPGPISGDADCVVWPLTALASLPFIPHELELDLANWRESRLWTSVAGPYGLKPFRHDPQDAERDWRAPELIGIDVGAFAVALANWKHGTVWRLWKQHTVAAAGLQRLGIKHRPAVTPSRPVTTNR